jgi:tRNA (guanine-N7-)-methyltransferase
MRFRNVKNKEEILGNSSLIINNPLKCKGKWNEVFDNNNLIYLEIGVGKCNFIYQQALRNPDINFVGVEKFDSVLAHGVNLIDKELDNLKLINFDAIKIDEIFEDEISLLFLNFSDPWPKARHIKRRLTSSVFLNLYESIFKEDISIVLKTDNKPLFEYSLEILSQNGYMFNEVCLDLQKSLNSDNIMTEYETKFVDKGLLIYMFKAIKKR